LKWLLAGWWSIPFSTRLADFSLQDPGAQRAVRPVDVPPLLDDLEVVSVSGVPQFGDRLPEPLRDVGCVAVAVRVLSVQDDPANLGIRVVD
jgi:hypothetical protein